MSAPEPRVRVEPSLTAGWHYWVCDACGFRSMARPGRLATERTANRHEGICKMLAFARLQARWYARDEALRGLVGAWLDVADAPTESVIHNGIQRIIRQCADQLARAIGDDE